MSFKENVIEICKSQKMCYECPLIVPCDRANNGETPSFWKDKDFDSLKQHLKEHHAELSEELTVIEEMLKED